MSLICPACRHKNPDSSRFCAQCAAPLSPANAETMTSPAPVGVPSSQPVRHASDGSRFLPGTMLGGRYRMVGLLGRGGMGEVYRADDLKVGQPVALKFLPRDVERHPERLERFLTEVRLSLKVTHPNVCRVFDMGEVDGRHFLSMEFVDGEDLASLLRRIGRLPEDKAIEIARQLCAGLAAAHDEGVLHRDLKPANVMIDGRGRAKITDFGLAGATAGIIGAEARVGTPQYMAPEQVAGHALTERTDLYSLGLVLYEIFTGKRAFNATSLEELARLHSTTPTSPSAHVTGLNPLIERAILRCLDPDPAKRLPSASLLAAALPGGDPLAMALAAGETPSPELVARAGSRGELKPPIAAACLVALLAGMAAVWFISGRTSLVNVVPMSTPPAELVATARATLASIGYAKPVGSVAYGFDSDTQYFRYVETTNKALDRWKAIGAVVPAPVRFWYRESPDALAPVNGVTVVDAADPPLVREGMSRVRLDPRGRLQSLRVVPPVHAEGPAPNQEPDWGPLFAAAGLPIAEFQSAEPRWAPPDAADVRRAWTRESLRIEAAAWQGRPVWFFVIPPWRTGDERTPTSSGLPGGVWIPFVFGGGIALAGGLMARRNLRLGRGDRRGAFRVAAVIVILGTAADLLRLPDAVSTWFSVASGNLARRLFDGALVWIFYVAVEPYVRRLWPTTLIAWNRVLEGRLRDPLVGRHILIGGLFGLALSALFLLRGPGAGWLGSTPDAPVSAGLTALAGPTAWTAEMIDTVRSAFNLPVTMLMVMLVARVLLRRAWLAYLSLYALLAVLYTVTGLPLASWITGFFLITLLIPLLTRYGVLACLMAVTFSTWQAFPLTVDPSSWFFPPSVVTMALFGALAVYGFVVSLGGQKVFKDSILE